MMWTYTMVSSVMGCREYKKGASLGWHAYLDITIKESCITTWREQTCMKEAFQKNPKNLEGAVTQLGKITNYKIIK